MKKILTYFGLLSILVCLVSCSSTASHAKSKNNLPPVPEPKLEKKNQLTEAEKKALEEADLWVPEAKK